MDLDDEFGDLYTDVLAPSSTTAATASSSPSSSAKVAPLSTSPDFDFENDEDILYGATDSNLPSVSQTLVPEPASDSILDQEPAPEHCSIKNDINWDDGDQSFNREESRVHKAHGVAENEAPRTLEPPENGNVGDGNGDREDEARGFEEKAEEEKEVGVFESEAIPGISSGSFIRFPGAENGLVKNSGRGGDSGDDWEESDSDDDLQIVLNDSVDPLGVGFHMGVNVERNEVRSDDDDEDLVIVADGDPVGEEHEWGKESAQTGVDGERKEMGDAAKASGGVMAGLPGIGYNSHGFTDYSLKYVRPGAAALPGGALNSAGGAPGQVRPLVNMGPIAGHGRGDWIVPMRKGFQPGIGLPVWGNISAVRGLGNRSEFTLPPHKTAFDIDIATFEEKLWRHPGVDTSDFFNFGLDEDKWKDYCKQLEQLRLEATMQSKIRVYESGRSEQDYDPDLPPELVAAAGRHDTSIENPHLGKTDIGQPDLMGHGRGVPRIRPPIPMGRAIQVEGGYGERLPSIDTRPPRFRDSDSIIEIALQGSVDDDSMTSNGALEGPENVNERDDVREGGHMVEEDDKQGDAEYFERFPPPSNGRMQEMVGRRAPFLCPSPGNNVHEGDGILPFPSDAPLQYHPSSKNRATYPGGLLGTPHGGRWSQGVSRDRYPQMGCETVNDAIPNPSALANGCDGHQNEILGDGLEEKQTSEASFPLADEAEREHSIEQKNDFHNDNVLADIEVEGEETVSDLRIPSETTPDSSLNHSAKKQKLSSRIEQQPAIHDLGDDLRTQSESSKAKSGNSRDYQKLREGGEEEVVQDGRSKKVGDVRRCREEEEHTSFRRKDDYRRDGKQEVERSRMAAKGRGDLYHAYPRRDWDANSTNHVRVKNEDYERTRERDDSIGARQRREEEPHGRLGCVLYTLLCGFPPFYDESIQTLTEKVARGQYTFLSPWWDDISKSAQDLVSHLLTVDPEKRYDINQFLNHPWIREADEPTYSAHDAPPLATPAARKQERMQPDFSYLESPGARRQDFRSPGAVNLREVFDVGYAVHRQEEEGKRRKNFKQGYRGANAISSLNALDENEDDDEFSAESVPYDSSQQHPPAKLPKSQGTDVSAMEQKMRNTSLSAAAQARQQPRQQEQRGYGQHSPAVAAAAKRQVKNKGAFELSLEGATLLGRRGKKTEPSSLREQISAQ